MEERKEKKRRLKLYAPWAITFVAILLANVGFAIYATELLDPARDLIKSDTNIFDVKLVDIEVPSGDKESIVGVTRTETTPTGNDRNRINLYNRQYYKLLENDENYNSFFEDIYHQHLRVFLNEKIGIDKIASIEQSALLNAGYDLSTPRSLRIATQVRALENLYYSNLLNKRAIQKQDGVLSFTNEMNNFIDKYYELFRPVKVQTLFIPFKGPLYYTPLNYAGGEDVETIYKTHNSFTWENLFSTENQTKLNNVLKAIANLGSYATTNSITNIEDLFKKLHKDNSSIIDKTVQKDIDIEISRLENQQEGVGYLTLSSQTFDQRLKSYSGSYVPSQTNQSLVNTYLALDSANINNNTLSLGNQKCDDLDTNKNFQQLIDPVLSATGSAEVNIKSLLVSMSSNLTIENETRRRLSPCFAILPTTFNQSKEQVIVNSSNYGIHFTYATGNTKRMADKTTFKELFKTNLLEDLKNCISNDINIALKCDIATSSILPSFVKTKYFPLTATDILNSINTYESNAREILTNYQTNVRGSFNGYGINIWTQTAKFMSFELGSSVGVPIDFDVDEFIDNERWK